LRKTLKNTAQLQHYVGGHIIYLKILNLNKRQFHVTNGPETVVCTVSRNSSKLQLNNTAKMLNSILCA